MIPRSSATAGRGLVRRLAGVLGLLACLRVGPVAAQEEEVGGEAAEGADAGEDTDASEAPLDDSLSRYRTPFGVLAERTIGTASRPVEFNWRRSTVMLAASGRQLFELNNFNSLRGGALARLPSGDIMLEFGLNYVNTWDTYSSRQLALTPYRQPGRPDRLEIDFNVGLPLAEGIVTTAPRFFPAVEMVFNAYAGLRYGIYTSGFRGMRFGKIMSSLISPGLTEEELDNLESKRLRAMKVDPARYLFMAGLGNDLYFKQGLFISPRLMVSVPLLAPTTGSDLLLVGEFTLAVGVAL